MTQPSRIYPATLFWSVLLIVAVIVFWISIEFKMEALSRRLASIEGEVASHLIPEGHVHSEVSSDHMHTHSHASHPEEMTTPADLVHPHHNTHPPDQHVVVVPEWEPVRYVCVAIPDDHARDSAYLRLIGDLAELVLRSAGVNFLVVIEASDVVTRATVQAACTQRGLDSRRVEFLEVRDLDSIWLRDYGPLFLRDTSGGSLFVVDTGYRDARLGLDSGSLGALFGVTPTLRPSDDFVPTYFASFARATFLHPGILLNCGDFYSDGADTAFTSFESIHLNQGDRPFFEGVLRQHCGVNHVVYLRPLPGPVVKHVDMFFKLVSPKICLVGSYRDLQGDLELACLQRAARQTLDANAVDLERLGLLVIRIPMPDITTITRMKWYQHVFPTMREDEWLCLLAKEEKITPEVLRAKLEREDVYIYRTFVNSLSLVDTGAARQSRHLQLLVPTYSGLPEALLKEARAAYESAYRQAENDGISQTLDVAFVNADVLAPANGSLRCICCTIPVMDRRQDLKKSSSQMPPSR
jgi:agmatine/peptidylarginine deiminase